jgi:hypothetical protein
MKSSRWLVVPALLVGVVVLDAGGQESARPAGADAKAAFGRLKQLQGAWDATSTAGWEGAHDLRVIGRGSALLSVSTIDPHPGADEGMATVFHLDRDRLLLTHYCVAGNQPRLVASSISDEGRRIEFEFLDGTNMKSPGAGHMHRAVFTIQSPDRYESRWTFFRDGKETWMETIVNTRRAAAAGGR